MSEYLHIFKEKDPEQSNQVVTWCGKKFHKYAGAWIHTFNLDRMLHLATPPARTICPDCWQAMYQRINGNDSKN